MLNRIRIAFVIPSLTRGGAERQVLALLRGLDRSRFETTLVLFDKEQHANNYDSGDVADRIAGLGIPAGGTSHAWRLPTLLLGAVRLARILRQARVDVLHTFLPIPAMIGSIAAHLTKVPVFIVGCRSMAGLYRRNSRVVTWLDRMPLRVATAVLANCEAIRAEAVKLDKLSIDRTFTIYNGVDTDTFYDAPDPELRRELGFLPGDVVFGTIANFHYSKRHIDLVLAAQQLRSYSHAAKFLLVGADRGELAHVRSEVHRYGMDDAFAIRPVTRDPERFHRALDVYVSASETEGMSNSILESMSSAKPVIATTVGGNAELVSPGITGYLVPSFAPKAIATCGIALLNNRALSARFGNARRMVEQRFSVSAMLNASEALYTELVKRRSQLVFHQASRRAPHPSAAALALTR